MGQAASVSTFADCLNEVCGDRSGCVAYPDTLFYQSAWVDRFNLAIDVEPTAVTRPETTEDVAGFVQCAASSNVKVQARGGGHSYANYGVGGDDGALVIDMRNFQHFSMDKETWRATIGAGHELSDVTDKLHEAGKRAMAHGVCPSVGIGGHATIGGLGPNSRMWGSALDHVLEVEVVTADGKIQRASAEENSDLFWALKGSGAGFGVITEFVVKTHPEPGNVVEYSFSVNFGSMKDMAPVFKQWQDLIADPDLDRRFGTEFTMQETGAIITGTFYGTEEEWEASGIPEKLPRGKTSLLIDDWLGVVARQAEEAALVLSGIATEFSARSLAFREEQKLSDEAIDSLMQYMDDADRGTLIWFLIFDASGGAVSDVATDATSYAHRDKFMFVQGYGVGFPALSDETTNFINGIVDNMVESTGTEIMAYPGYVDPTLGEEGQKAYWGSNLPRLEQIKTSWDPNDVFHNPQSVRPANGTSGGKEGRSAGVRPGQTKPWFNNGGH